MEMTTVFASPLPVVEEETAQQKEEGLTKDVDFRTVVKEVFLDGNMPLTQEYIISSINAKSYTHFFCLYIPNVVLRGISQVFLCNNPVTGVFTCIGLSFTSIELMFFAIIGSTMGNIGALVMGGYPIKEIENGLAGKDGTLVGAACFTFLDETAGARYGSAIVLSFTAGFLNTVCSNFMNSSFSLPALTIAFNLVILSFMGGINTDNIGVVGIKDSSVSESIDTSMSFWFMVDSILRGIGQFIFADTTTGGLFVVLGIAVASRPSAFSVIFGSLIACITALYIIEIPDELVSHVRKGLYGFNTAGVFVAISGNVFYICNWHSVFYGIVASFFSVFVLVSFKAFLGISEWSLPVMTLPFCVTTWLMMYLRAPGLIPLDQNNAPARHTVQAEPQSSYLDNSMHSFSMDSSIHSSSSR